MEIDELGLRVPKKKWCWPKRSLTFYPSQAYVRYLERRAEAVARRDSGLLLRLMSRKGRIRWKM